MSVMKIFKEEPWKHHRYIPNDTRSLCVKKSGENRLESKERSGFRFSKRV